MPALAVVFSDDERNALILTRGSRWAYAVVGRDAPRAEVFAMEHTPPWCGTRSPNDDRFHLVARGCREEARTLRHVLDVIRFGDIKVDASRCETDNERAIVSVGRVADVLDDAEVARLFGRPWPQEIFHIRVYASPSRRLLIVTQRGGITDVMTTENGDLTTATALTKTPKPAPNEALALASIP